MPDRFEHLAPVSVDELAAFDAGVLDPARAAEIRTAITTDPRAQHVLAALSITRAELAGLRDPDVPPDVAARWASALAAVAREQKASAAAQPPRWFRRVPRPLWFAVAAAAVVVSCVLIPTALRSGHAADPGAVLAIAHIDLADAGRAAVGEADFGALADPQRRAECLQAVGVDPSVTVLGGRRVLLENKPGVLLVLATGKLGQFRLLVVDEPCGRHGGTVLADHTLGGTS